jgi:hypothetical protein
MNPLGDTLLLRNSPDRRDNRAGHLFATDFFEEMRSHCIRTTEKCSLRIKEQARAQ